MEFAIAIYLGLVIVGCVIAEKTRIGKGICNMIMYFVSKC